MQIHQEVTHRVLYADTDSMGVVYNAVYLVWFEKARTEWLRSRGLPYREVTMRGLSLPVTEATLRFRDPAKYDELVRIQAAVTSVRSRGVTFSYTVRVGERLVAEGSTSHVAVQVATGHAVRFPDWLFQLLQGTADAGA